MTLGVTNPTQLWGKEDLLCNLGYTALFLSETSHTHRALPRIRRQIHRLGWHGSFGKPVQDHTPVSDPLGSLRGCAEGVASISHFPIFSSPQRVGVSLWDTCRVQVSTLQLGHLPLRIVNLYLKPGALKCQATRAYNTALLNQVVPLVVGFHSPVLLTGDFNSPLNLYEPLLQLLSSGWQDLAVLSKQRWGIPLQNTCRDATRHTFMMGSPEVFPFLVEFGVHKCFDLHDHDILWGRFSFPDRCNSCFRWIGPSHFDGEIVDRGVLSKNVGDVMPGLSQQIDSCLENGDTTKAFEVWSKNAENMLASSLVTEGGERRSFGAKFFGRGAACPLVKSSLWEPRFKDGDFNIGHDTPSLRCRLMLKQVRRLQTLIHLVKRDSMLEEMSAEALELWQAVVHARGFGKSFSAWCLDRGSMLFPSSFPMLECVQYLKDLVATDLQKWSSEAASFKKKRYRDSLERSLKTEGGRLPFRLLRAPPSPPVSELAQVSQFDFSKFICGEDTTTFFFHNTSLLPGDVVFVNGESTTVSLVGDDSVTVDSCFPNPTSFAQKRIFVHPDEMAKAFFHEWDRFWNPVDCHVSDEAQRIINRIPPLGPFPFGPITWHDWRLSLKKAKEKAMIGADGWSIWELRQLPQILVEPLLSIHRRIEEDGMKWPRVLVRGFLIWLNKDPDSDEPITWESIRPITVLSTIYRLLSRVRARQCLTFARRSTLRFVQPALSTTVHWTKHMEEIQAAIDEGATLSGFVLDLLKAFNTLQWETTLLVASKLRIPDSILRGWKQALVGLRRSVLINGTIHGEHAATCGFPEGDPLSVFGMFVVAFCWGTWTTFNLDCVPFAFADNLEVSSRSSVQLKFSFQRVKDFCRYFKLTLSPAKCWFWSTSKKGRREVEHYSINGEVISVKYCVRNLGASLQYTKKKSDSLRKKRFQEGIRRLARLKALPLGVDFKCRLLFQGIWPQCLHGSEADQIPHSAWKTLRANAANAIGFPPKGRNPFLVLSCTSPHILDPEFVAIVRKIRNLRHFLQVVPDELDKMLRNHSGHGGKVLGPACLLVQDREKLGILHHGDFLFVFDNIPFHAILSPLTAILQIISMAWRDHVASQVCHRKDLSDLRTLCDFHHKKNRMKQRDWKLVQALRVGQHFTMDIVKHWKDDNTCPFCGRVDGRLHRFEECPLFDFLRSRHLYLFQFWHTLPIFTRAYGLISEPPLLRPFWGMLAGFSSPSCHRKTVVHPVPLFTDGSCFYPAHPLIRIASFAIVRPLHNHDYIIESAGILPGQYQTIQRAELTAGIIAFSLYDRVHVFTDSAYFFNGATAMIHAMGNDTNIVWPSENLDLWVTLYQRLQGVDLDSVQVFKVKAHMKEEAMVTPFQKWSAYFNDRVDKAAKTVLRSFWGSCRIYRELVISYFQCLRTKRMVDSFHLDCALLGLRVDKNTMEDHMPPDSLEPSLEIQFQTPQPDDANLIWGPEGGYQRFVQCLLDWISSCEWFTCCVGGSLTDTSWFEIFAHFVHDTGLIPPFEYSCFSTGKKEFILPGDKEDWMLSVPTTFQSFQAWRKILSSLERQIGLLVPGARVPIVHPNLRIPGVRARLRLSCPGVSFDLFHKFARARRISQVQLAGEMFR